MTEETKDLFTVNKEALQSKIIELLPMFIEKELSDSYSSPIKKAVEEAIKDKDGEIKKLVQDTIGSMLLDASFKEHLNQAVIAKILSNGLKN